MGQYVNKIDSYREVVNVYVDVKAGHRKSGNAFVVNVNYFRKKSFEGGCSICVGKRYKAIGSNASPSFFGE